MNGPEHYREAEQLLDYANRLGDDPDARPGHRFPDVVAEAQVHATLALAAASAGPVWDRDEWVGAAS